LLALPAFGEIGPAGLLTVGDLFAVVQDAVGSSGDFVLLPRLFWATNGQSDISAPNTARFG